MSEFMYVGPCNELSVPNTENMRISPHFSYSAFVIYNPEPNSTEEMLKISKDGFWVRGVKVEQGPWEAEEVYAAFLKLLGVNRG